MSIDAILFCKLLLVNSVISFQYRNHVKQAVLLLLH